jgi:hypothetical protein
LRLAPNSSKARVFLLSAWFLMEKNRTLRTEGCGTH